MDPSSSGVAPTLLLTPWVVLGGTGCGGTRVRVSKGRQEPQSGVPLSGSGRVVQGPGDRGSRGTSRSGTWMRKSEGLRILTNVFRWSHDRLDSLPCRTNVLRPGPSTLRTGSIYSCGRTESFSSYSFYLSSFKGERTPGSRVRLPSVGRVTGTEGSGLIDSRTLP